MSLSVAHFSIDFFSPVEEIGIHVHVFAGSLDELCSPCTSALLADTLKLGTLHLVRGVGHISGMMECWQVLRLLCLQSDCSAVSCPLHASRTLLLSLLDPIYPYWGTAQCCLFSKFYQSCDSFYSNCIFDCCTSAIFCAICLRLCLLCKLKLESICSKA